MSTWREGILSWKRRETEKEEIYYEVRRERGSIEKIVSVFWVFMWTSILRYFLCIWRRRDLSQLWSVWLWQLKVGEPVSRWVSHGLDQGWTWFHTSEEMLHVCGSDVFDEGSHWGLLLLHEICNEFQNLYMHCLFILHTCQICNWIKQSWFLFLCWLLGIF